MKQVLAWVVGFLVCATTVAEFYNNIADGIQLFNLLEEKNNDKSNL